MVNGVYIYLGRGFDFDLRISLQETALFKMQLIGIDPCRIAEVPGICASLHHGGINFIELCGGFGPIWISKVKEAVNHEVPVGGVFYGPEDREALLALSPIDS